MLWSLLKTVRWHGCVEFAAGTFSYQGAAFGNYVIQHILDHVRQYQRLVMQVVVDNIALLSRQKFSSNVVEKVSCTDLWRSSLSSAYACIRYFKWRTNLCLRQQYTVCQIQRLSLLCYRTHMRIMLYSVPYQSHQLLCWRSW